MYLSMYHRAFFRSSIGLPLCLCRAMYFTTHARWWGSSHASITSIGSTDVTV